MCKCSQQVCFWASVLVLSTLTVVRIADRYTYVCMMLMGPSVLAPIFDQAMIRIEGAAGSKGGAKLLWPLASAAALAAVSYTAT